MRKAMVVDSGPAIKRRDRLLILVEAHRLEMWAEDLYFPDFCDSGRTLWPIVE